MNVGPYQMLLSGSGFSSSTIGMLFWTFYEGIWLNIASLISFALQNTTVQKCLFGNGNFIVLNTV
jgi:hypothetical protein